KDDAKHAEQLSVVVNVKELPELTEPKSDAQLTKFQSPFWNELENHKDRVGIVVSLATLRRAGAAISSGLSWEHAVEDITAEMHLFPKLKALSQFRHLFIRVDLTGLVHIENTPEPSGKPGLIVRQARLYFAPYADDAVHRDWEFEGSVIGKNTLLIARLI